MALQTAYKQFLAAPNPSFLAPDASLHYITTLVTLNGPEEIIKHLKAQDHELKKVENFLDAVEGQDALAVEVHTTIEFLTGGGSFLPGLDDNFLTDRTVSLPIIHIVSFDANGKILQVRQNWDQGSLLKLLDVIGKTGRNWPIRDGTDQMKLIASSVKSAGKAPVEARAQDEAAIRSRGNSNNVTRDPHASLSLFAPREKSLQESLPSVVATRTSARPAPRDYSELFVGNEADKTAIPEKDAISERSESPSKLAKAGAGKNYAPSRLFDNDENSPIRPTTNKEHSADHLYRANPAKYQHFDFADGSEPQDAPQPTPLKDMKSSKHGSQWHFDDFNTPAKVVPSKVLRTNDVRHWGNSDDEAGDSPIKFKKTDKPRKDAETHFEFQDDGTPEGERRLIGRPRGSGQNTGLGLYKDHLFAEEEEASEKSKEPKPIANVKDRRKDFDPHFSMTDESPASKPAVERIGEDRARVVKMMDANWSTYDQSPNQKENAPIPTSPSRPNTGTGKGVLSESTNTMSNRNDQPKGISIGGDGMGGKKGAGRQWGFGDDSGGEEVGGLNKPSKFRTGKQGKQQPTGGDFWDF